MFAVPAAQRLANLPGVARGKIEQTFQSFELQMRLIAERYQKMGDTRVPALPICGALDGAEHAAIGVEVQNPICAGKMQPVQFFTQGPSASCTHYRYLPRSQSMAFLQQMAEHGSLAPRQKQLWRPHPS